nr:MAG TPA: ERF superfamily protein [Caudoviricetes sp.]
MSNEELKLNAALQQKKNSLRKALAQKGTIKKDKSNTYDRYSYLSEAGYKELFTTLLSEYKLELTTTEVAVVDIEATEKQPFGRRVTLEFKLTDIDTGYSEASQFSGEGFDKGDKGIYKAYTGALKYYLASTFNVATGDDAETESPDGQKTSARTQRVQQNRTQTNPQIRTITAEELKRLKNEMEIAEVSEDQLLKVYGVEKLENMTNQNFANALDIFDKKKRKKASLDDI